MYFILFVSVFLHLAQVLYLLGSIGRRTDGRNRRHSRLQILRFTSGRNLPCCIYNILRYRIYMYWLYETKNNTPVTSLNYIKYYISLDTCNRTEGLLNDTVICSHKENYQKLSFIRKPFFSLTSP